jgi:hypothetical protein
MRKLLAILKALLQRQAKIESVEKSRVSKSPGDVTMGGHN